MKAIVYGDLTFIHKKHPIQFKIGLGIDGKLKNGRIKDVDLNKLRSLLEEFNFSIRDKDLFTYFDNYKGMETIAIFYLNKFKDIDFVEVLENNTEKIIVNRSDI